jgi:transcriptional regulator with XRE-family HTH domain
MFFCYLLARMSAKRQAIIQRLATQLRDERVRQGLSLSEVAARAGIDRTMVMRVEERERTPTIDTLLRMAEALEIDLWKILREAMKAAGEA